MAAAAARKRAGDARQTAERQSQSPVLSHQPGTLPQGSYLALRRVWGDNLAIQPTIGEKAMPHSTRAYALSGSLLISFDPTSPATGTIIPISGVTADQTVVGIDFRPSNGLLYGLGVNAATDTATLYSISAQTGIAAAVGTFGGVGDLTSGGYGFDFNPSADRIRVTSETGLNFRLNP